MQTMLQDGVYDAQLANVAKFKTANGRDALEFLWAIEKPRTSVKSVLVMTKDDGTPNTTGISLTQGWAKDWKGDDINWFIANLSFAKFYRVSVTIEGGKVKWVNERNYWASRSKSKSGYPPSEASCAAGAMRGVEVEERKKPTFTYNPELLAALPPEIAPTMKDAWAAFRFATNDKTNAERESKWFEIIRAVAPGKMQIDFTADEWRQVIAHITNTPNTNH